MALMFSRIRNFLARFHLIEYFNVSIASLIVYGPLLYLYLHLPVTNDDYHFHLRWAQQIASEPHNVPPEALTHAGWQWLVWLSNKVLDLSWGTAALAVTLGSVVATSLALYWILRKHLSGILAGALSVALLIIAPYVLLDPLNNVAYMTNGYFAINVYHNPTTLLLKFFIVIQFALTVDALGEKRSNWLEVFFTAVVSALAAFSKPSYVICLLPALGILILVKLMAKKPMDWAKILLGIFVPSLAILIWQFALTFGKVSDSTIIFAPFLVMNHYATRLFPKFVLSIVFPLIVTLLYWKKAIKDWRIVLGWLGFIFGALLSYLFAETGTRQFAANFFWSAEVALFLLFSACVWFLAENKPLLANPLKKWLVISSGFGHVIFGVTYYYFVGFHLYSFILTGYWW